MNWRRRDSLLDKYKGWWQDFPFSVAMAHVIVLGLIIFLFSQTAYRRGDISWFWPAFGIAAAFLACLGLLIPGADDYVR